MKNKDVAHGRLLLALLIGLAGLFLMAACGSTEEPTPTPQPPTATALPAPQVPTAEAQAQARSTGPAAGRLSAPAPQPAPSPEAAAASHEHQETAEEAGEDVVKLEVLLGEFYFQVEGAEKNAPIVLEAGKTYELELKNVGNVLHEVAIGKEVITEGGKAVGFAENLLEDVDVEIHGRMLVDGQERRFEVEAETLEEVELEPGVVLEVEFTIPEDRVGDWEMACFVPGHYEAGMRAPVQVVASAGLALPKELPDNGHVEKALITGHRHDETEASTEDHHGGQEGLTSVTTGHQGDQEAEAHAHEEDQGEVVEVTLRAYEWAFEPNVIEVPVGQRVKLTLVNDGLVEHDVEIEGLPAEHVERVGGQGHENGHQDGGHHAEGVVAAHAQPGQTATVYFTPTQEGEYDLFCTLPGHRQAGMEGKIVVTAGSS